MSDEGSLPAISASRDEDEIGGRNTIYLLYKQLPWRFERREHEVVEARVSRTTEEWKWDEIAFPVLWWRGWIGGGGFRK